MDDYISKLPDDILCHLVSFLPMRDAVRTRSLSAKWKDLPDCRSILEFTPLSVFGKDEYNHNRQAQFAKVVNQFLEIWKAKKACKFKLDYCLTKEYASHIDGWIASVTQKRVEELNLTLRKYVLPCHLLHSEASCLKHLHLEQCELTLCSGCKSGCKTWLTQLTTLDFKCVTLLQSDIDRILSAASNLTSITMISSIGTISKSSLNLNVKLPFLKKFVVRTSRAAIDLNSPYLEIFNCDVICCNKITFSHLPLACLREVYLRIFCDRDGCCSCKFVHQLTTHAPKLQYLYLMVNTEVPPMLASIVTRSLKHLHLRLSVPVGFDLFTITDFLHDCPTLEELHIELWYRFEIKRSPERQYPDRQHFQLKKVTIERYCDAMWKEMEFAIYLLRNCIALEQMVIVPKRNPEWVRKSNFNLLQGVHPTAEVIISHVQY